MSPCQRFENVPHTMNPVRKQNDLTPPPARTSDTADHTSSSEITIHINGESRRVEVGCTVTKLLVQLKLDRGPVAVERNLELVPRAQQGACQLQDGDQLEIVTLVGGG